MRVLLTGANGFIGSYLTTALLQAGHQVTGAVRDPKGYKRRFPAADSIPVNLNVDTTAAIWGPRLRGVDVAINCAGILQDQRGQSSSAIHAAAPIALFDACVEADVGKVVQISAISATKEAGTEYATTKLRADEHLRTLDLDWTILRPSLVYAAGSYGGTSLLRALAATPYCLPVVGAGNQAFQPLHVDDLTRAVLLCLTEPKLAKQTLDPVGPERLTLTEILRLSRAWLGYAPAPILHVPPKVVALACRIGDVLQAGALRTTSLRQIEHGNAGDPAPFIAATGFTPRTMAEALGANPAQAQDRWHARLFLLRPAMTSALAAMWLASGLLGLLLPLRDTSPLVTGTGIPDALVGPVTWLTSLTDLALAGAVLVGPKKLVGRIQLAVVAGYTLFLTATMSSLWLDPFGSLLKNLPVLALIAVWMAIAEDR